MNAALTQLHALPQADASGTTCFALSGELNFANVTQLLAQGQAQLAGHTAVLVDLSAVTHSDSAGLALLIEWLRLAKLRGATLRYAALPGQLQALAAISEVSALLSPVA